MREIRQSGSEGGGDETNRLSLPLFRSRASRLCRLGMNTPPTALVGLSVNSVNSHQLPRQRSSPGSYAVCEIDCSEPNAA